MKKKKKLKIFTKWHINWTSIPSDYCQLAVWLLPAWQLLQMYSTTNSIPNRVEPYLIVIVTINMVISKLQSIYSCSVRPEGKKELCTSFQCNLHKSPFAIGSPNMLSLFLTYFYTLLHKFLISSLSFPITSNLLQQGCISPSLIQRAWQRLSQYTRVQFYGL